MNIATKIPVTLEERTEFGETMRIPASWEEFLDLLPVSQYRIEYDNGEIISFMGYANEPHEVLTAKIIHLLSSLLDEAAFSIMGSNLAIHIPGTTKRYYNADCTAVRGKSQKITLSGNMTAIANPALVVEVLSDSTKDFDLNSKFRNYRKIDALEQILYVDSTEIYVLSYTRQNRGSDWLMQEFSRLEDQIPVLGQGTISVGELYRKIQLPENPL